MWASCELGTCTVNDLDAGTTVLVDGRRVVEVSAWLDAAHGMVHAAPARRDLPVPSPPPRGPCRDREAVERGDEAVTVASYGAWNDDTTCTPIARSLAPAADLLVACRDEAPAVVEIQPDGQLGRCEGGSCTCTSLSGVAFGPAAGARRLVLQAAVTLSR